MGTITVRPETGLIIFDKSSFFEAIKLKKPALLGRVLFAYFIYLLINAKNRPCFKGKVKIKVAKPDLAEFHILFIIFVHFFNNTFFPIWCQGGLIINGKLIY
jgi:hypothetical protein